MDAHFYHSWRSDEASPGRFEGSPVGPPTSLSWVQPYVSCP